jgi:hypothetical protein
MTEANREVPMVILRGDKQFRVSVRLGGAPTADRLLPKN